MLSSPSSVALQHHGTITAGAPGVVPGWTGAGHGARRDAEWLSMSGPVSTVDAPPSEAQASAVRPACVEITPSRESVVGAMRVRRALPRIGRRTVGAWCFADHMGPELVTETRGLDIGPHPHTGLQTVTWLVAGEVLHRDSLGSEQVIRTGQLNLMTAGEGVTHSEEATGRYRGQLHGVQLWVAQPEATRHGAAAFEHHAELPRVELDNAVATILVGSFAGAESPARRDTELVGVDLALWPGTGVWPLAPSFEHALVVLDGEVLVGEQVVRPGELAYLGQGRDQVTLAAAGPTRVLLLGGEPFAEPVLMWWNFVVRSRDELDRAYRQWESGGPRFGRLRSPLPRIPAPKPFWPRPT
jgi:quercetin 2,3-dioxygenase